MAVGTTNSRDKSQTVIGALTPVSISQSNIGRNQLYINGKIIMISISLNSATSVAIGSTLFTLPDNCPKPSATQLFSTCSGSNLDLSINPDGTIKPVVAGSITNIRSTIVVG